MKQRLFSTSFTVVFAILGAFSFFSKDSGSANLPSIITHPLEIKTDEWYLSATTNLLLVPENRSDPGSRMIPIHFYKFPAKNDATMPPVLYLPGGPGGSFSENHFTGRYGMDRARALVAELEVLRENREVIFVNQRGHSFAPGFSLPDFEYGFKRGSKDEPLDLVDKAKRQGEAFAACISKFEKQGVDVAGYDIINIVDDLEDIRRYFKYDKVALVGTSFGSQWAFGYMHRYPERVDRAMLSGVEPLDFGWDDARGIWRVLEKIEEAAMADPSISEDLPEVGLIEAYKIILQRLEQERVEVDLVIQEKDINERVIIGPSDFIYSKMCPYAEDRKEALELWPKYIAELYNEDYDLLAYRIESGRDGTSRALMINHLIDNSLGISKDRQAILDSRDEIRWIGDPSINYKATMEISPTRVISDDFRRPISQDIPILMIQGDMDWNTPIGNAIYVQDNYKSAHLITVERGTHSAKRELMYADKDKALEVFQFMNKDFENDSFQEYKKSLPDALSLPAIDFDPIHGRTILGEVLGHPEES